MRRKLAAINLALVALAAGGLWKLHMDYGRAKDRYRLFSSDAIRSGSSQAPGPAAAALPAGLPLVQPASYLEAAEKYLFSADRNPTVVVEPPKLKERPALPILFGVMSVGGGPIAIVAEKQGAPHKTVRVGEMIGEFKLVGAAGDQITLEWEGQSIHARVSDVLVKPSTETVAQAPAGPPLPGRATPPSPPLNTRPGEYVIGPAVETATGTIYQSPPGDSAPHGAVYQGKRKVVRQTPFGTQSWWEDVKN